MIRRLYYKAINPIGRRFRQLTLDFGLTLGNDLRQREKEFEAEYQKRLSSGLKIDFNKEFQNLNSEMMLRHSIVKRILREYADEFGEWKLSSKDRKQLISHVADGFRRSLRRSFDDTIATVATSVERDQYDYWENQAVHVVSKNSVKVAQSYKKNWWLTKIMWLLILVVTSKALGKVIAMDPYGLATVCRENQICALALMIVPK